MKDKERLRECSRLKDTQEPEQLYMILYAGLETAL